MSALAAWSEYAAIEQGVELGYLCPVDGAPCDFETRQFLYGEDADGNRGVWVDHTACVKCGEPIQR
jgi:hypothetical protein